MSGAFPIRRLFRARRRKAAMSVFFRAAALARVLYDSTIIHDATCFSPLVIAPDVCLFARRAVFVRLSSMAKKKKRRRRRIARHRKIARRRGVVNRRDRAVVLRPGCRFQLANDNASAPVGALTRTPPRAGHARERPARCRRPRSTRRRVASLRLRPAAAWAPPAASPPRTAWRA